MVCKRLTPSVSRALMWATVGPHTEQACGVNRCENLRGRRTVSPNLAAEKLDMRYTLRPYLLHLILTLSLSTACCTPSLAGDIALLSIGPRIGFSRETPLLGRRQTASFRMADVSAVFTLPWSRQLGDSAWSLKTRLTTSAGLLEAADDHGLMMTVVPGLALHGWNERVRFDAGAGAGVFSRHKFGAQDFGGPVQIVLTMGFHLNPFSHAYTGFRVQHFSDAGLYGSSSLGVDLYIVELGYRFSSDIAGPAVSSHKPGLSGSSC